MWQKAFEVVLVTFLVIFTAAGAVLMASGVLALIFPRIGSGGMVYAYAGGVGPSFLKFLALFILVVAIVVVSILARRKKLP
ncbi:MAG TPA: hypothetical protein VLE19_13255 [Pyrinomonadaceae bacterium]|nr:hypothetical protein [Pyrinomonadaceae bacterium]